MVWYLTNGGLGDFGLTLLADFQSIGEVFGFDTVFLKALSWIGVGRRRSGSSTVVCICARCTGCKVLPACKANGDCREKVVGAID